MIPKKVKNRGLILLWHPIQNIQTSMLFSLKIRDKAYLCIDEINKKPSYWVLTVSLILVDKLAHILFGNKSLKYKILKDTDIAILYGEWYKVLNHFIWVLNVRFNHFLVLLQHNFLLFFCPLFNQTLYVKIFVKKLFVLVLLELLFFLHFFIR